MSLPIGTTPDPAPVAPAATPQPQADPALVEQIRSQVVKDIFGDKFEGDINKARKGYWDTTKYVGQLESLVASQAPSPGTAPNDPFKRLADESLIPVDVFKDAVRSMINDGLNDFLGPLAGQVKGREQLIAKAPQYVQDEPKVLAWADSHPELAQRVQQMTAAGFPLEALQLQYTMFLQANPQPSIPPVDPKAGLPGAPGSAPNRETTPSNEDAVARLRQALSIALGTKNEVPLWDTVFGDFKPKLPAGFPQGN